MTTGAASCFGSRGWRPVRFLGETANGLIILGRQDTARIMHRPVHFVGELCTGLCGKSVSPCWLLSFEPRSVAAPGGSRSTSTAAIDDPYVIGQSKRPVGDGYLLSLIHI